MNLVVISAAAQGWGSYIEYVLHELRALVRFPHAESYRSHTTHGEKAPFAQVDGELCGYEILFRDSLR
jgi:hypothetical protein